MLIFVKKVYLRESVLRAVSSSEAVSYRLNFKLIGDEEESGGISKAH